MKVDEEGKVAFISNDGQQFVVPFSVAKLSGLAMALMEEYEGHGTLEIRVAKASAANIRLVVEYCTHYTTTEPMTPIPSPLTSNQMEVLVQEYYFQLIDGKHNKQDMCELMEVANFLDIKPLLELCCATVASWVWGRTTEDVEQRFGSTTISRADIEEQVRRDYAWARDLSTK